MGPLYLFHAVAFGLLCFIGFGSLAVFGVYRRDVSSGDLAYLGLIVFFILAQGLDLYYYQERIVTETLPVPATVVEVLFQFAIVLILGFVVVNRWRIRKKNQTIVQQNQTLLEANDEIQVLLREIHHRVRNNLQTVVSLLSLEARSTDESAVRKVLDRSKQRINSITLVHDLLQESDRLADLSLDDYIRQLINTLTEELSPAVDVETEISVSPDLSFPLDTMIPVGLVLNELISNSLEHAFENAAGTIRVRLEREGDRALLEVRDDGKGFPDEPEDRADSLGLSLVRRLVESKLQGDVDFRTENGSRVRVTFPLPEESAPASLNRQDPAATPV